MSYMLSKTLKKGSIPVGLVIAVNIAIQIAKTQGFQIDPNTVWSVVGAGYGAVIAIINYLKNHKKAPPAKTN